MILPIHQDENHWICALIFNNNYKEKITSTITLYDSLNKKHKEKQKDILDPIIKYLRNVQEKEGSISNHTYEYETEIYNPNPDKLPKQKNGFDCGMYLLVYVEHVLFHRIFKNEFEKTIFDSISFEQSDIDEKRKSIKKKLKILKT